MLPNHKLSACHEKEETFTSVAAAEADAGDKKNEAESKAAEEKPDKAKADPGGEEKEGSIWVYVCGEVASPGVYELQEGDRITHAIEAAGGLTEAAGQVYLNQAAHLTDGQRIYVPLPVIQRHARCVIVTEDFNIQIEASIINWKLPE